MKIKSLLLICAFFLGLSFNMASAAVAHKPYCKNNGSWNQNAHSCMCPKGKSWDQNVRGCT